MSDPSLVQQLQLGVRRIVIDPGHGAKDPGGVSKFGKEKSIVLRVAKKLKSELIDRGYEPILTRETDDFIHLKDRSQFANENAADLFVSIHANSAASENANGIETYYLALASDESAAQTASRENAGSGSTIHILDQIVKNILQNSKSNESERLARCVQESLISRTNATDRGVRHAPFVVLIGTKVPAILIELGFLTNADESQKLIHPDHQNELAIAIADGIEKYIANATIE